MIEEIAKPGVVQFKRSASTKKISTLTVATRGREGKSNSNMVKLVSWPHEKSEIFDSEISEGKQQIAMTISFPDNNVLNK